MRPAHSFKSVDVLIMRQSLRKVAIFGEPFWFIGAKGNAAVALSAAVRIQKQERPNHVSIDLAMTAVLCLALEGHTPAAVLLSSALRKRSSFEPHCTMLSDAWLHSKTEKRPPNPARTKLQ